MCKWSIVQSSRAYTAYGYILFRVQARCRETLRSTRGISRVGAITNWDYLQTLHARHEAKKVYCVRCHCQNGQIAAAMKVVEVVIDGFKSYAVRTVISGWDESFNSITGLNGSGKSNILDAICFVLGITSMSTVRAQNIQVGIEHSLEVRIDRALHTDHVICYCRISFTSAAKRASPKPA